MKSILLTVVVLLVKLTSFSQNGKVGINTSSPQAMLHVKDSSVLFTSPAIQAPIPGNTPVSGSGVRMMWYADKSAFRSGRVLGDGWDKDNIGYYSFACGYSPVAQGDFSIAAGYFGHSSGDASFAIGSLTEASGYASAALGSNTTASAASSMAIGSNTIASGSYSIAAGHFTLAKPYASMVIGQYNDTSAVSSIIWNVSDPVFIIGNGSANNSRNNAFTILKSGFTGINTAIPEFGLHVVNTSGGDGTYVNGIMVESTSPAFGEAAVSFKNQSFLNPNAKWITGINQADPSFRWDYGIAFNGSSPMKLDTFGNLTITGIYSPSDARLKKNIDPLENSLQKIIKLNGYNYNWIDKSKDQSMQTGLLAQEVEIQMPELVKTDNEGIKSVNYNGLIPYLVEAIKQQQKMIDELKKANRLLLHASGRKKRSDTI